MKIIVFAEFFKAKQMLIDSASINSLSNGIKY